MSDLSVADRIAQAVRAVLPPGSDVDTTPTDASTVEVDVGSDRFTATWVGQGWLGDVRAALDTRHADVLVAKRMSPAARAAVAEAGLGYVDEAGAAEITLPGLVVSRTASKHSTSRRPPKWTRSVVGTAEALLLGVRPTVAEVEEATGLSTGAATNALAVLTRLELLRSDAARGRNSAREVVDRRKLLDAYAEAAVAAAPTLSLRVGLAGRDLVDRLASLGLEWDARSIAWAATGAAAASVLGPYLTEVNALEVYVDAPTPATMDALARRSDLPELEGGRLLFRPFPTPVTRRLSSKADGLRVVPWPRVLVDLRAIGVRGEEAAEHLWEVMTRDR